MNFFVAVTDYEWFRLHASKPKIDEVNFWRPSPTVGFSALHSGEILLFKLHAPWNLPISLAWEAFEEGNGVRSLHEMRDRIAKYRRAPIGPTENPPIGCILLAEPFFWAEEDWIPVPADFSRNIVTGDFAALRRAVHRSAQ